MITLSTSDVDAVLWELLNNRPVTDEDRAGARAVYARDSGRSGSADDD